jgi:hypothetical protein
MADKFLYSNAGILTEKEALTSSAGAGDAGKIPGLDATGRFDPSMMPVGLGAESQTIQASEALAAGDYVNIWTDTGAARVRKADATSAGKEANGFVLAAVSSGASATVYAPSQTNTQLSGLTPGAQYYLSTTAGGVTTTPPSGSGNVIQKLGRAGSATTIVFAPSDPIVLA